MKIKELLNILHGTLINPSKNILERKVQKFSIDSRNIKENELFVPLKGEKFDGHQFIEDALKKGALAYLTEKKLDFPNGILVKNTYKALIEIGKYKRKKLQTAVGITGTSGKTTTKELLKVVLSQYFKTYATEGNFNNEIGVPLTLSNIPEGAEIGIFELGAGKVGDIDYLAEIVNHDIGVLTSVGHGHTEKFGSYENVLKGKGEIFSLPEKAVLPDTLLPFYREKLNRKKYITFGTEGDIRVENVYLTEEGTEGIISYKNEKIKLLIPVYNRAIFLNIGAVAGALYHLDINPVKSLEILENYTPLKGRGNILKKENLIIIDDTYNANPLSVKNAIETLSLLRGKKIIVLGDMLELGEYSKSLHEKIGETIEKSNIDTAIFYGKEMKYAYKKTKKGIFLEDKKEIAQKIKELAKNEKAYVLLKGSRGMKMEEIIDYLLG